jgi:prepilin-type N-terminal cleavage/methylation domain-containing protein
MKNNKGFTLIELIMVTIILGILAAVAIPRYTTSVSAAEAAAEDAALKHKVVFDGCCRGW